MSIDQNVVKETVSQLPQYFIDRLKEPSRAEKVREGKYEGAYGGILLIRYIALLKIKLREFLKSLPTEESEKNCIPAVVYRPPAPPSLHRTLSDSQKENLKDFGVNLLSLSYEECLQIYRKLLHISDDYNTEDGQIRWLQDHGFPVHLHHFWFLIPEKVKQRMNKWKYMNVAFNKAIEIREKLEKMIQGSDDPESTNIEDYNTEDGQIRWLQDHGYNLHLARFWTIIPAPIKKRMTNWKKMDMSFQTIREIREKLEKMIQGSDDPESTNIEDYNTEDGQIRWLQDHGYNIHLAQFWSVIPQAVKYKMTRWRCMKLTLKEAVEIRVKLENMPEKYNTKDGQIRWLQDHGYNIHLAQFWSVIPQAVKYKMTCWKPINVTLDQAINIQTELKGISDDYNTEDGQIRWLQDHGYNIHLAQFWSVIPQAVKYKMTCWKPISISLDQAIEIRVKLENISDDYNTENGQVRWLQDHGFQIHLVYFWKIIPEHIKDRMTNWHFLPNIPLSKEEGEELKGFLSEFLDSLALQERWSPMKLYAWTSKKRVKGRTVIRNYIQRCRREGKIDWLYVILNFVSPEKLIAHPFIHANDGGGKFATSIHATLDAPRQTEWEKWQMQATPTPEELSIQKEEVKLVRGYISSLAPDQQAAIERYYDGENVPSGQLNPLIISIRQHLEKNGVDVDISR